MKNQTRKQSEKQRMQKQTQMLIDRKHWRLEKKAKGTMGESKKRLAVDEEVKEKKKRRSRVDTMSWLKEKTEIDAKLKEKELEDQKQKKRLKEGKEMSRWHCYNNSSKCK